jgi:hypothetical protein
LLQISGFAQILISGYSHFVAHEWIRRSDIRIFRDFATGAGTWYCVVQLLRPRSLYQDIGTDFISGYLSDIWGKNIGYFQP